MEDKDNKDQGRNVVLPMLYHQQDRDNWCGAACVQMVLHSLGQELQAQTNFTRDINASEYRPVEGIVWSAAPDGLCNTLNNRSQQSRGTWAFQLFEYDSEPEATRRVIWSIYKHKRPALALTHGFQHWLLIRGYITSAAPQSPGDTAYDISGLDLYDPWPPVPPELAQFRHQDSDRCGSGNHLGTMNEHIWYAEWQPGGITPGFMTGVPPSSRSHWRGKFLVICAADQGDSLENSPASPAPTTDTEPTGRGSELPISAGDPLQDSAQGTSAGATGGGSEAASSAAGKWISPPEELSQEPPGRDSEQAVSADDAREKALAGLQASGLATREPWGSLISLVQSTPAEVYKVEYLQEPDAQTPKGFYYLVVFYIGDKAPLAVRVDAHTGTILQARAATDEYTDAVDVHTLKLWTSTEGGPVTHVWTPSADTLSPFHPFYRQRLGTVDQQAIRYIRRRAARTMSFPKIRSHLAGL